MSRDLKELLMERAVSAFRERNAHGRILPSPAWMDLAPEERDAAFQRQLESRLLEYALESDRQSTTVRAVLDRLRPR